MRSKLPDFQKEISERSAQLDNLKKRAEEAEAALVSAKAELEDEKQTWTSEIQQRIMEEKQKWREEISQSARGQSPVATGRKGLTSEYLGLQNMQLRRGSARSTTGEFSAPERFLGRRPSGQPLTKSPDHGAPVRQGSTASLTHSISLNSIATNGTGDGMGIPQTPLMNNLENDEFFENHRSSSPQQTLHDIISTATAGAGPSVQLVERMSSAVRKLESEKVASREEVGRLIKQRDEARMEIVGLMREVEGLRGRDEELGARVKDLERELEEVKGRYEVTLELLGEKSEEVLELRGDVEDLKGMYRELVVRSVGAGEG